MLAVIVTWPLAIRLDRDLAIGQETTATVPLFNAWTLWWNINRITDHYSGYWDAPIFFPVHGSFAFSEPQPLTGILAWCLFPFLRSVSGCYNVLLLTWLTLNGWTAMGLLRQTGVSRLAAWSAGCMTLILPFVHLQAGVLQLTPLWPVLWTIGALERLSRRPSLGTGMVGGLAFAVTFLTCQYYALMLGTLMIILGWCLWRAKFSGVAMGSLIVALGIVCLICGPLAWVEHSILRREQMAASHEFVQRLSLEPRSYLHTHWPQWLTPPVAKMAPDGTRWALSPGSGKLLAAAIGIYVGLVRRRLRRWTCFWSSMAIVAGLFSMGTRLSVFNIAPFLWLTEFVPGYVYFRSPFRFACFVQLATVVLAAQTIHWLLRTSIRWSTRKVTRRKNHPSVLAWMPTLTAILLSVFLVGEAWPPSPRREPMIRFQAEPQWVGWIRRSTPPQAVLCFVPFPQGRSVHDYLATTQWMIWQTKHHRRMVNGYSGFFPDSYRRLKLQLQEFPDSRSVDFLVVSSVDYCVVFADSRDRVANWSNVHEGRLELGFESASEDVAIYRVKKRPPNERTSRVD